MGDVSQKTNHFIKSSLIVASVFMHTLEIWQFLYIAYRNEMLYAYWVDILESFLQVVLSLFLGLVFNDRLVFIKSKFWKYACRFAYG